MTRHCQKMSKVRSLLPLVAALAAATHQPLAWSQEEIPFVPTPMEVVDRMLDLAQVKKADVIYDLGSGDGRILIRAAKKYGARGVGIEMDRGLVELARKKAEEEGVSHLVEFRAQDALMTDVSPATVVTLYMLPWFNEKMRPVFQQQLRPDARVVSHDFNIEGWPPTEVVPLPEIQKTPGGYVHQHTLYLWKIPDRPPP